MGSDDHSGARPAGPIVLRIKLRYEDTGAMVLRFAPNVGKSGLFLPTRSLQPIGTEVKFELRLVNDTPVLVGLGRVKHVREPDPENPRAAFGISLELMRVSREGRELIIRMIERRRALGLPDVIVPTPDDIDAARRAELERADSGVVRDALAQFASAPVAEQVLTPGKPSPAQGSPVPEGKPRRVAPSVPPLAPEAKRVRPRLADLIAKAGELSGPLARVPELDEQVDVERALARARALAGGDLDAELAALHESAAAPTEISVEAASAELARQLGGQPIGKRARWAPPPAVEPPREILTRASTGYVAKTRAETAAAPTATIAAVTQAAIEATATSEPIIEPSPEQTPTTEPAFPEAPEEATEFSPSLVPSEAYVIRKSDRIESPYGEPYEGEGYRGTANYGDEDETPVPTGDEPALGAIARASADMMIDDDADLASFERALDAARIHTGVSAPAPPSEDDERDFRDADLMAQLDQQLTEAEDEVDRDLADMQPAQYVTGYRQAEDDDEEIEEIDDMDVVAIADEDDEDLLEARAEPVPAPSPAPAPPPDEDFASRLELGDDEEPRYVAPRIHGIQFRPHETGEDFDEPHVYRAPQPEPSILNAPSELEQALTGLDVDLDPSLHQPRPGRAARPLPGLPVHRTGEQPVVKKTRANTDEGVLIDFDDEE